MKYTEYAENKTHFENGTNLTVTTFIPDTHPTVEYAADNIDLADVYKLVLADHLGVKGAYLCFRKLSVPRDPYSDSCVSDIYSYSAIEQQRQKHVSWLHSSEELA